MKLSTVLNAINIMLILGLISIPIHLAAGQTLLAPDEANKPPEGIQGGEWTDDFWIGQLEDAVNMDVQASHLLLKYKEQLHWAQTWTAHFSGGEFWHTEAVSDSVRLVWDDGEGSWFSTGIYTSTVFNAGRTVDWSAVRWRYSGIPDGLVVEFRTGNASTPDGTWTSWQVPVKVLMENYCAYTYNSAETECYSNLAGINSSQYMQYRASFSNQESKTSVSLYEIDFVYGIHHLAGSAVSILIPPMDLRGWESVIISSTVPANTTLVIDLLDANGMRLISDLTNGSSLEGIDPRVYPALKLQASFTSTDESISPDIGLWGLRWSVWNRVFLPVIFH
ncbi:MAG: hypothetical protein ACM3H7_00980 [Acidobacteriaceae bacterium]